MQVVSIPEVTRAAWPVWNVVDAEALTKKLESLHAEGQELMDRADGEQRDLTAEEQGRFDKIFAEFRRVEQLRDASETVGGLSRGRQTTPEGPENHGPRRQSVSPDSGVTPQNARLQMLQRQPGIQGRRFADLFGAPQNGRGPGFRDFNEFLEIVNHGLYDPRLIRATGMLEGEGATGGFLVPVQYSSELLDAGLESEIVRPRARIEPMTSNIKAVGTITNSDNSTSAPYGGLSMQWMAEAGTITPKQATVHMVNLKAHKGAILVPVSNELLADGRTVEEQLSQALISSVSWSLDLAFLTGTGSSQPLGVLNAPSLITVSKEGGQQADTLNYLNVTKMYAALHPSCVANSVWVANSTCMPALLTLNAAETSASAFIPAVTRDGGQFTLLGRPLLMTEKLPVLGDKGDILLVDFSKYIVGLRQEISVDSDRGLGSGFSSDQTNLRVIVRADGIPAWAKSVTPKNGNAQSWAVVLEAR